MGSLNQHFVDPFCGLLYHCLLPCWPWVIVEWGGVPSKGGILNKAGVNIFEKFGFEDIADGLGSMDYGTYRHGWHIIGQMLTASRYQLAKDSDPKLMMAYKNRFELLRDSKSQCTFTTRGLMASNTNPQPRSISQDHLCSRRDLVLSFLFWISVHFPSLIFFSSATLAAARPFCIQWTGRLGPRKARISPMSKGEKMK